MAQLPREKIQPGKSHRSDIFTDTGTMHTTVTIKFEAGHRSERKKYLIQSTTLTTVN